MILTAEQIADLKLYYEQSMEQDPYGVDDLLDTIADLQQRLAASEAEKQQILEDDRLVQNHTNEMIEKYEHDTAELRDPMSCGHPKACWVKEISDRDGWNYDAHRTDYCSACARENERIAQAQAERDERVRVEQRDRDMAILREIEQHNHDLAHNIVELNERIAQAYERCADYLIIGSRHPPYAVIVVSPKD